MTEVICVQSEMPKQERTLYPFFASQEEGKMLRRVTESQV